MLLLSIMLPLGVTVTIGATSMGLFLYLYWRGLSNKRKSYPNDTVILHNMGRGPHVPSLSPFAVKLETYLRMAGIKYQIAQNKFKSSKGKFPWIEYNNIEIADSEFCIQFLNREFNVNLNSHLTKEERAIGRAFQKMTEEGLFWTAVIDRWLLDQTDGAGKALGLPSFCRVYARVKVSNMTYAQGTGRHSKTEVLEIMRCDLESISHFIGQKKFLFGDKPSQYDCSIFGLLTQMRWESFGGYSEEIVKDFPNICEYLERMKNEFWSDWDECNTAGGTKTAKS